jgi:glycerol uptake facilitator protein
MERPLSSVMLAEVYGTFLLTFVGATAITVASDPTQFAIGATLGLGFIGLAHGLALLAGIASVGSISGGFFNPAVTIGMWTAGRFPKARVAPYIVAQLIGATLAAIAEYLVVGQAAASIPGVDLGSNLPNLSLPTPIFSSMLAEIVGTMFLAMAVMGSTDEDSKELAWSTSAIGLVMAATIWAVGAISGASLNPARSFGPAVVSLLFTNQAFEYYPIYVVGPVLGAIIAAILYRAIYKRVV